MYYCLNKVCNLQVKQDYFPAVGYILVYFCCCDKTPNQKQLRGKKSLLGSQSKTTAIISGKSDKSSRASYITPTTQRETMHPHCLLVYCVCWPSFAIHSLQRIAH